MLRAGIIGATGYSGTEVLRLLGRHPDVEPVFLSSQTQSGVPVAALYPALHRLGLSYETLDVHVAKERCDVFFICLPHGEAAPIVGQLLDGEHKIIDLSADLRLPKDIYEQWYGPHPAPALLDEAVYGLPELNADPIPDASLVANPGCYPTGALLALAPVVAAGIAQVDSIIVDSKSGVSGAGRTPGSTTHFCAVNDSTTAYNVAMHRHTPEIELGLSYLADTPVTVTFTPNLVPMTRGILTIAYCRLADASQEQLDELYADYYAGAPFVFVRSDGSVPATSDVVGSNECHVSAHFDARTNRLVAVSAIDNLIKGAAGQAIQNMNLMYGLDETAGLELVGRTV